MTVAAIEEMAARAIEIADRATKKARNEMRGSTELVGDVFRALVEGYYEEGAAFLEPETPGNPVGTGTGA